MRRLFRLSVWLVPLAAAIVVAALLTRIFFTQGPTVTVSFQSADGLEAGRTKVRYRAVDVGRVKAIRLSSDDSRVLVDIQLTGESGKLAVADTRFWVVRARIGTSGVSGLSTLISGAYIGVDPGHSTYRRDAFTGLETPPAITTEQNGRRYILKGDSLGSVDIGSPVYYRHMLVGRVIAFSLDGDGNGVTVQAFVDAPYDRYVKADSGWWHASGVDLRLDSKGMSINTQSIATVLTGGLAFQSRSGSRDIADAKDGSVFPLANTEADAMREPDGPPAVVVMKFNQSLRGLSVGAPVDFRGIEIGYVTAIGIEYDAQRSEFAMPATIKLFPSRLGKDYRDSLGQGNNEAGKALLQKLISDGLRGQLRTGNLLTGQLYIALDMFPHAAPARVDMARVPPELPTVPNTLEELQVLVADIAKKLDRMPLDKISNNLNETLSSANSAFEQLDSEIAPQARETLASARDTFRLAQEALRKDSPLQTDTRRAISQLNQTLQSLNELAGYLQRHPESLLWGKSRDTKP